MNKKIWKRTMQVLGLIIILGMATFSYKGSKSNSMTYQSSLTNNTLAKCSDKPNCVSSFQNKEDNHYISPLSIKLESLTKTDDFFKECHIKISNLNYRHIECSSKMFKFIDDIELLYHDSILYFRSGSRVGHSDLGVNRKRIESLKSYLNK